MSNKRSHVVAILFLATFGLFILHGTKPLWEGGHVLKVDSLSVAGVSILELKGGDQFAFHQKSKQGEPPKVLDLNKLANATNLAVVVSDYEFMFDTRWSPHIMRYDGEQFFYANVRPPKNSVSKSSGQKTHRFMNLPFGASYSLYEYDLLANTQYYLLLPQNTVWQGKPYSVEIRARKTEFGNAFLFAGIFSMLLLVAHGLYFRKKY